jgi:FkbM family methyltransferase
MSQRITRNMLKKVLKPFLGRKNLQFLFERLHELSLVGMNFGGGSDPKTSGETAVLNYLRRHVDKEVTPIVFDVGANTGGYASHVISFFGRDVKLFCFEPSKKAFRLLAENMANYENVQLYNIGFGQKSKVATLYADAEGSGLGSVYNRRLHHLGIDMVHREEINLSRLDKFCGDQGIAHVHLIKLDVEGSELDVLKGAKELIDSDRIGLIQFEIGGCNIDSRTYLQDFYYLLNPKYKIHRIVKDGLVLIDKYSERYEVFLTSNYLAVHRNNHCNPVGI